MLTNRSRFAAAGLALLAAVAAGLTQASVEDRATTHDTSGRASLAAPIEAEGRELYLQSCASCHGADGSGTALAPTLIGVGAAAADFQLTTGRMPFTGPPGSQATRKPPRFDEAQINALVAYIASLGPGPAIPTVTTSDSLVGQGFGLFIDTCAPCHGANGRGGAVGGGALAPPLDHATPLQVAEAMITGPGQMPVFSLADTDANAVASYVAYLQRAPNPGGFSIGGIGPVPEGFVAWALGMASLFVIVYLIGQRWEAEGRDS
jgi:ubiquinol-cytochrome c reductase cytochrome c subunit